MTSPLRTRPNGPKNLLTRGLTTAVTIITTTALGGCGGGPHRTLEPPSTTAPDNLAPRGESSVATLYAVGDIAACQDDNRAAETAALLTDPEAIVATLGDHAYEDGTAADFADCYDPTWGSLRSRTRPAPGNHDYHSSGAAPYYSYFGQAAGDPNEGWYSYDLGAWHVVVLNSECDEAGGCDADSPQVTWLRDDLAKHPTTCLAAYWHKPRFSSGTHGSSRSFQPFWEVLAEHGADVILNGHDHDYERFAPQDPTGQPAPHGARQFVVGTGGKDLRGFDAEEPNSEARDSDTYGVLELTLHAESYEWKFLPIAGQTFTDSGSAPCH